MKDLINDLYKNRDFLRYGAEELKVPGGRSAWIVLPVFRDLLHLNVTLEVNELIKRKEIKTSYGYSREFIPTARGNKRKRVRIAKFCGGKLHFIISPMCHGNGGWCGQSIEKVGKLGDLLKVCPGHLDHGMYSYDPEPRICKEPDVNKSVILWDSDELTWTDKKTNKVLSRFSSRTTYAPELVT